LKERWIKVLEIMIVDDEALFREHLKTVIDWEYYDFNIACEAKNGKEALENMEKHNVDIALVDIKMPFVDGLEFSRIIREKGYDTEIVLITGHNEFEYAKHAIKIGVSDYILKPFDKEELILTLLNIKRKIEKARRQYERESIYKKGMREILLNGLVSNTMMGTEESIFKHFEIMDINLRPGLFKVLAVEMDNIGQTIADSEDVALYKFAIANIWDEIASEEFITVTFNGQENRVVSILQVNDEEKDEKRLLHYLERLCELVRKYLHFTITVGVGNICDRLIKIRDSYKEALIALQNKYVIGAGKPILYRDLSQKGFNIGFFTASLNEEILYHFRSQEKELTKDKLQSVYRYIIENRLTMDYVYSIFMGLVSLCLSYLEDQGYEIEDVFGKNFLPFSAVRSKTTVRELYEWITVIFDKAMDYSSTNKMSRSRKIAQEAKQYIDCYYYNEDLTVEMIAENLYINSSWLRTVFKKEMNMQISKYILAVRMQKAKEFLKKKIKVSDVANMVGFSDPAYFSKVFKKYTGMSPTEYEANF